MRAVLRPVSPGVARLPVPPAADLLPFYRVNLGEEPQRDLPSGGSRPYATTSQVGESDQFTTPFFLMKLPTLPSDSVSRNNAIAWKARASVIV